MFLRILLLVLFLAFGSVGSIAQGDNSLGTAVYIELVGKGFISANADLSVGRRGRLTLGLTMLDHEFEKEASEEHYPTWTLPTPSCMYFHLFGQERHYFETGVGLSVSPVPCKDYSPHDSPLSLHGSLGYRFQTPHQFFFRAGLTPFYRVNWMLLPLVGVSFGYSW